MSRPKLTWRDHKEGDHHYRADYGHVSMAVYTKREPDPALHDPGSYRVKPVIPKHAKLSSPSTFGSLEKAKDFAEDEARRIHAILPPVDHRTAYENQEKAVERDTVCELIESTGLVTKTRHLIDVIKQFVEMCAILLEIKMEPLQAACQAVKLHRMTAATGEDPVEMVGKYLDYFVRVREVVPIETLVNKAVAQIEKCDLGDGEKKSRIRLLRKFAEERKGRTADSITVEELKHWRLDLACGRKTKYDHWLILRSFIENAYKDHGAIRKNVYERMMELDFVARSKTLDSLLPYRIWTQLFSQCQYSADVLYLALLSDVPIRPEEIGQIDWRDITPKTGMPRWIKVPAEVVKGKTGGVRQWRTVRIPRRLGKLLLRFRRESGLVIPGTGHLARLRKLARKIDPAFDWIDNNVLRRTCISHYVHAYGRNEYYAEQAGHTVKKQKERYLRYVEPMDARHYVLFNYNLEEFKALPYEPEPAPNGRPRKISAGNQPSSPSSPAAENGQAHAEQSEPATL